MILKGYKKQFKKEAKNTISRTIVEEQKKLITKVKNLQLEQKKE